VVVTALVEGEVRVGYSAPLLLSARHLHLLILTLTAAVLLLGLLLALYKRWQQVPLTLIST
jgi:hypothetical protein